MALKILPHIPFRCTVCEAQSDDPVCRIIASQPNTCRPRCGRPDLKVAASVLMCSVPRTEECGESEGDKKQVKQGSPRVPDCQSRSPHLAIPSRNIWMPQSRGVILSSDESDLDFATEDPIYPLGAEVAGHREPINLSGP
ncbi:hypothetical protein Mapa_010777 [Marchantia paleacea]|nr:hypothetical protein Mapa_010777 [Marchantia paleacea]